MRDASEVWPSAVIIATIMHIQISNQHHWGTGQGSQSGTEIQSGASVWVRARKHTESWCVYARALSSMNMPGQKTLLPFNARLAWCIDLQINRESQIKSAPMIDFGLEKKNVYDWKKRHWHALTRNAWPRITVLSNARDERSGLINILERQSVNVTRYRV